MANQQSSADGGGHIQTLRQVAQQHLEEIDTEIKQEQEQEAQRIADLEYESRRRQRQASAQSASHESSSTEAKSKGARMRTAQDVMNRLRWSDETDISQYQVGYLDRFGGCLERSASAWLSDSTEEEWIPQHRIRYFKKTTVDGATEIMWDRDKRIDKIFGSVSNE